MKSKGERFEDKVYSLIKDSFAVREFGLDPARATYQRRPKYYSRDRESFVEFDISIEVRIEPKTPPFITMVIECKDYNGSIPIDDLEEFKAKLDQCFGKNVKGILFTKSALQKSAVKYANNHGICVARILPNENIIFNHYSLSLDSEGWKSHANQIRTELLLGAGRALTEEKYMISTHPCGWSNFFALAGEKPYISPSELFGALVAGASPIQHSNFRSN